MIHEHELILSQTIFESNSFASSWEVGTRLAIGWEYESDAIQSILSGNSLTHGIDHLQEMKYINDNFHIIQAVAVCYLLTWQSKLCS